MKRIGILLAGVLFGLFVGHFVFGSAEQVQLPCTQIQQTFRFEKDLRILYLEGKVADLETEIVKLQDGVDLEKFYSYLGIKSSCEGFFEEFLNKREDFEKKYGRLTKELTKEFGTDGLYGISNRDFRLLMTVVIYSESSFSPNARSGAGAIGFCQLTLSTAKELGVNPAIPEENLRGGFKYMRGLLEKFQGNVSLALGAYNAGPSTVENNDGLPMYRETLKYVFQIMYTWQKIC